MWLSNGYLVAWTQAHLIYTLVYFLFALKLLFDVDHENYAHRVTKIIIFYCHPFLSIDTNFSIF